MSKTVHHFCVVFHLTFHEPCEYHLCFIEVERLRKSLLKVTGQMSGGAGFCPTAGQTLKAGQSNF